ncbi:MAG: DUF1641 domain-containing protein [Bacillota bacterium]
MSVARPIQNKPQPAELHQAAGSNEANPEEASIEAVVEQTGEAGLQEMLELLRGLQKTGQSMDTLLEEINKLQTSGTLQTLLEVAGVIKSMKDSLETGVITGVLSQLVSAITVLDHIQSLGGDKMLMAMAGAMSEAIEESKDQPAPSPLGLFRQLKDAEARKSMGVLATFLQKFSSAI